MRIVEKWPPSYVMNDLLILDPQLRTRTNIISTYGGVIYNPHGLDVSKAVEAHEKCHAAQQTTHPGGPRAYLKRYVSDKQFRLSQEVEAYKAELAYCVKHGEKLDIARTRIAKKLLNEVYSFGVTLDGARFMLS